MYHKLEKFARTYALPIFSGVAKSTIAYPRYYTQLRRARKGFHTYSQQYGQTTLYVAGLPKSGTTWLEKMLSSLDGFQSVMIPQAVNYEQKNGESHTYEFNETLFEHFKQALVVLKLHAHGSTQNFQALAKNNQKFVVLYRDLRDVAVSYIFYVKRTAYHPEHKYYKLLDTKLALRRFAETLLPEYIAWIDSWDQYKAHKLCYMLSYEQLLENPIDNFKKIISHYNISITASNLKKIIAQNKFNALKKGNQKDNVNENSFYRKGKSGDWINYFDNDLKVLYKAQMGDFLIRYGYEENNW